MPEGLTPRPDSSELPTLSLRAGELVELSERLYRNVLGTGLYVALLATLYALALVFIQVGDIDRALASALCIALACLLAAAARAPRYVYERLRRQPALAVAAGTGLAVLHLAIGAGSQLLFPPSLVIIGLLATAVSAPWVLGAGLLVAAGQAAPMLTHDLSAVEERPLIAAAAADVVTPLLFAFLLERLARFMLDMHRVISTAAPHPPPPLGVTATATPPAAPPTDEAMAHRPEHAPPRGNSRNLRQITARQHEAIALASEGLRHAQIAACMQITPGQVARLLAQARARTGTNTTAQLVAWAIANQLIPPPEAPGSPVAE